MEPNTILSYISINGLKNEKHLQGENNYSQQQKVPWQERNNQLTINQEKQKEDIEK